MSYHKHEPATLLAAFNELLQSAPPYQQLNWDDDSTVSWLGRAQGVVSAWDPIRGALFRGYCNDVRGSAGFTVRDAPSRILAMLHEARTELGLIVGPISVAVDAGRPFEYFESVRGAITAATTEVFFVDRFLEADFVSRFLTQIKPGVTVRLLTRDRVAQLLPAVVLLASQDQRSIEVRSSDDIHDRFVFVDNSACYFSGGSFKDGGKNSPTIFSQVLDYAPLLSQYEAIWQSATPKPRI